MKLNTPPPTRTMLEDTEVFRKAVAEHVEQELQAVLIERNVECPRCATRFGEEPFGVLLCPECGYAWLRCPIVALYNHPKGR